MAHVFTETSVACARSFTPKTRACERTCILVLGMHRSGTSALTRILSLLGADLPKKVMGAGPGNEAGHWEPEALIACHDRLLEQLGSRWDDWYPLGAAQVATWERDGSKEELKRLVQAEYESSSLFVLKDPRICRFAGFYTQVLREIGVASRYILTLRNPLAVMASLGRRDGMGVNHSALLWLRYVLDSEFATRGSPRAIISYEHLVRDYRSCIRVMQDQAEIRWPRLVREVAPEIQAFLAPELQHHKSSSEELAASEDVTPWVKESYDALLRLEGNPDDGAALGTLDLIREKFDSHAALLATSPLGIAYAELRDALERVKMERHHALAQIDGLVNSRSYKLMQPLRKLYWVGQQLLTDPFAHETAQANLDQAPDRPAAPPAGRRSQAY